MMTGDFRTFRLLLTAALGLALAACGGGDGDELAAGNGQLDPAQIDAALGPADQGGIEDANPANADMPMDNATLTPADNAAAELENEVEE
jgi:hypothetical protein